MHEIISQVEILPKLMTKDNHKPNRLGKFWGNKIAKERIALKVMKPLFQRHPKMFTECGRRSGTHWESNCPGLCHCSSFEELSNWGYS